MTTSNPDESGVWLAYQEPSKNWPMICTLFGMMLALVIFLVLMLEFMSH